MKKRIIFVLFIGLTALWQGVWAKELSISKTNYVSNLYIATDNLNNLPVNMDRTIVHLKNLDKNSEKILKAKLENGSSLTISLDAPAVDPFLGANKLNVDSLKKRYEANFMFEKGREVKTVLYSLDNNRTVEEEKIRAKVIYDINNDPNKGNFFTPVFQFKISEIKDFSKKLKDKIETIVNFYFEKSPNSFSLPEFSVNTNNLEVVKSVKKYMDDVTKKYETKTKKKNINAFLIRTSFIESATVDHVKKILEFLRDQYKENPDTVAYAVSSKQGMIKEKKDSKTLVYSAILGVQSAKKKEVKDMFEKIAAGKGIN